MAIGIAEVSQAAPRGNKHGWARAGMLGANHQREQETQGCRPVAVRSRTHLVQNPADQPGTRQGAKHLLHAQVLPTQVLSTQVLLTQVLLTQVLLTQWEVG